MSWICPKCETENPDRLIKCEVCDTPREALPTEKSTKRNATQLNSIIAEKDNELAARQEECTKLKRQISSYKRNIILKNNELATILEECRKLRSQISSHKGAQDKKEKEIATLQKESSELENQVSSLKNKLRNTMLVGILVVFILGGIVCTSVLFPSVVSQKDMGVYDYYGPMRNGKPNGTGVAIFHSNDTSERLFYIGNFVNGERIDDRAILFYKDSSFFYGSINEEKLFNGLEFDIEGAHFIGEFKNNEMWNGVKYKHVKEKTIVNGK